MVGSAFELLADHVEWVLGSDGERGCRGIPADRRGLEDRLLPARSPPRVRPPAALAGDGEAWDEGMEALQAALES